MLEQRMGKSPTVLYWNVYEVLAESAIQVADAHEGQNGLPHLTENQRPHVVVHL